jgi:uncharacterized protein YndB with AHSA1/START domain
MLSVDRATMGSRPCPGEEDIMAVKDVKHDTTALTLVVEGDWDAPVDAVWQLWADPRKLERWWGPPTHPAAFVEHDLRPGGAATYFMTGPDGERYHGWWKVLSVDEPRRLQVEDGFADDAGVPNPDLPTTEFTVTLAELPSGATRMLLESTFPSREAMDQIIAMGVEEGLLSAMGQIDGVLGIEPKGSDARS